MQALGSHSTISDLVGSQNYLHIIICKESSTEEPRPKLTLAIFIHGLFLLTGFRNFDATRLFRWPWRPTRKACPRTTEKNTTKPRYRTFWPKLQLFCSAVVKELALFLSPCQSRTIFELVRFHHSKYLLFTGSRIKY